MIRLDKRRRTMLRNFLRDRERKNLPQIAMELTKCSLDNREMAGHYFSRMLYKRDVDNYMDYLTNREINAIRHRPKTIYQESLAAILDNKILFHLFFNEYDVRIPGTLGWNAGGQVNLGSDLYEIEEPEDLCMLLVQAMEARGLEGIFVKPSEGYGGFGCRYLGIEELRTGLRAKAGSKARGKAETGAEARDSAGVHPGVSLGAGAQSNTKLKPEYECESEAKLQQEAHAVSRVDANLNASGGSICAAFLRGSFIFQEPVPQHEAVSAVYPHSLNTLRIDTYIDGRGGIHLLAALIRFGGKGRKVDNSSSGGCFVSVDLKTGKLGDRGYQMLEYGGRVFYSHPETGVPFMDIKLPYFEEVKQLVIQAVELLPYRLTGWDIGITPDGPILLEGNSAPHLNGSDMAYGGFRRHSVYWEILREFTLNGMKTGR